MDSSTQLGSTTMGESAGLALPSGGLHLGTASSVGRTDRGPDGRPGTDVSTGEVRRSRALANRDNQARGPNAKGSFLRPAETPADIELNPVARGSGAEGGGFPEGYVNYIIAGENFGEGKAGGIASGTGSPGAAATTGTAGKSQNAERDKRR
jgi:hypothetical protein